MESPDLREAEPSPRRSGRRCHPVPAGRGGSLPEADGPLSLLGQVLDAAKKGQTIQRYKGLGEMNPDQLWRRR